MKRKQMSAEPWWDIRTVDGALLTTVRGKNEQDAMANASRQAYLIGILFKGLIRRHCYGCHAELTPSGGVHPF